MLSLISSKLESKCPVFMNILAVCSSLINRILCCVRSFFPIEATIREIPSLIGRISQQTADAAYFWIAPWILSKTDLRNAIIEAAKNGNQKVLQGLLPPTKVLDEDLAEALTWAIVNRHEKAENYLMSRGISKNAPVKDSAMWSSLINRILCCVRSFFPTEATIRKIPSLIGRVAKPISGTAYVWIAPWILSKTDLRNAIIEAAKNGNQRVLEGLLPPNKVLDEDLAEALAWAIVNRHEKAENYLMSRGISKK